MDLLVLTVLVSDEDNAAELFLVAKAALMAACRSLRPTMVTMVNELIKLSKGERSEDIYC